MGRAKHKMHGEHGKVTYKCLVAPVGGLEHLPPYLLLAHPALRALGLVLVGLRLRLLRLCDSRCTTARVQVLA